MEELYLKKLGRRDWCQNKFHLKSYFEHYSDTLSFISLPRKKMKCEMEIGKEFNSNFHLICDRPNELDSLVESTNPTLLTMSDADLRLHFKNEQAKISTRALAVQDSDENDDNSSCNKHKRTNRLAACQKKNFTRRDISLDDPEKCGRRDLNPLGPFMVSFRVHDPFTHEVGDSSRPGRCSQEIAVLNYQPLTALRDKIICVSDFQDIRGDISDCPEMPVTKRARDKYFSGMFYFDNTFYVDFRHRSNDDYSKPIKTWAAARSLKLGETKSMDCVKVEDLNIRFGFPYLYMHQGCCEHIVIVNDARLLTSLDSLYSQDYPLMKKVTHHNMTFCMLCSRLPAKWIVRDCDRLAHDPTFECKECFKSFHYINGKKVGHFKALLYWQKGTIL